MSKGIVRSSHPWTRYCSASVAPAGQIRTRRDGHDSTPGGYTLTVFNASGVKVSSDNFDRYVVVRKVTLPVATSYRAPTRPTFPSSRYFARYGLLSRISFIDWRTFFSTTFVTQASSFASLQPAASTAGWIFASRPVRLPSCTLSIAPLTAPQPVCPRTTISFVPTLTAYS